MINKGSSNISSSHTGLIDSGNGSSIVSLLSASKADVLKGFGSLTRGLRFLVGFDSDLVLGLLSDCFGDGPFAAIRTDLRRFGVWPLLMGKLGVLFIVSLRFLER